MSYIDEVIKRVRDADAARPRSVQAEIGWSEAGGCRAYLGYRIDGAWPSERGWYLGVSLMQSTDDDFKPRPPDLEVLWLEYQEWRQKASGDGWCVNELAADKIAERRDYWWVGKIKMPDVTVIKGED